MKKQHQDFPPSKDAQPACATAGAATIRAPQRRSVIWRMLGRISRAMAPAGPGPDAIGGNHHEIACAIPGGRPPQRPRTSATALHSGLR